MGEWVCRSGLQSRAGSPRRAFTLLEVILALAILAMSLAALGEVLRLGGESSRHVRDVTKAHLIASTKLAELTSGATILAPVESAAVEDDPDWLYSIEVDNSVEIGLVAVRLTVRQNLPDNQDPAEYSIVRWMPDPSLVATGASGSTGASGTSTGGTAFGGTSGGAQ